MNSSKWPAFFFLILTNLVALVKSDFPTEIFFHYTCADNSYTSNSTYKANLNTLLSSVSSNIDSNGFYNASVGENSDRVNLIALCRADLQPYQCRDYVANATVTILMFCPNKKQAVLWHEFCMVRYSNEIILGTLALFPHDLGYSKESFPNEENFNDEVNTLLDSLLNQAAYSSTPQKFAAASRVYPVYGKMYAFEQCTPDISPEDCRTCLKQSALLIPQCCAKARGVRILRPSCYLRFENYVAFYNETMVRTIQMTPSQSLPVPSPPGKDNNTTRTVITVVVPIIVCLLLALCIFIFVRMKQKRKPREKLETISETSEVESLQYDFATIRDATNNFSDANKLGQGGFGAVYKGKLPKGNAIAVKRLSRDSEQGDLQFKNEVVLVARLQHRNLVTLLGFCIERSERLLIYKFVENGSLDHFIFDPIKSQYLDWETRFKITKGVARGLVYLHEDSRLRIIHRDLKASNILLDGEMNPKISDFGLARLFVPGDTEGNTSKIVGTYGYMAPEYLIHGQFSTKSDVFSFGVLVLEIVTGRRSSCYQNDDSVEYLLKFAWKNWHEKTIANIIDPALRASSGFLSDIFKCIHIGLLCVQENSADRPTIASVILMLTSFSTTMPVPSQPGFFTSSFSDSEILHLQDNNSRATDISKPSENKLCYYAPSSINDATMSELYPR